MRRGHHHHLAGIARVGEDLLVTGHAGVEADLADGSSAGTDGATLEARAILQQEDGFGALAY